MKTASVLSSPNIGVESDGEEIRVTTFSVADDSAHTNSVVVGEGDYSIYKIVFKTENIKMIPGTYDVSISFKGIGHFKNVDQDIEYWIAFEATGSNTGE
jgi:F420-0:gamma-glutamyl ligase